MIATKKKKKNRNGGAVSKSMLILKTCKLNVLIYINKNVNVRLYLTCNLRKFFTDRLEILTQRCIRIREC